MKQSKRSLTGNVLHTSDASHTSPCEKVTVTLSDPFPVPGNHVPLPVQRKGITAAAQESQSKPCDCK